MVATLRTVAVAAVACMWRFLVQLRLASKLFVGLQARGCAKLGKQQTFSPWPAQAAHQPSAVGWLGEG